MGCQSLKHPLNYLLTSPSYLLDLSSSMVGTIGFICVFNCFKPLICTRYCIWSQCFKEGRQSSVCLDSACANSLKAAFTPSFSYGQLRNSELLDHDCGYMFPKLYNTSLIKGLEGGPALFAVFSLSDTTCPVSFWQTLSGQIVGFVDLRTLSNDLLIQRIQSQCGWHWTKGSLLHSAFQSLWFLSKAIFLWCLFKCGWV